MSSKEKAKELVEKFSVIRLDNFVPTLNAKQCALIAVEEMKKASTRITQHLPNHWIGTEQEYYEEVKQEIENL